MLAFEFASPNPEFLIIGFLQVGIGLSFVFRMGLVVRLASRFFDNVPVWLRPFVFFGAPKSRQARSRMFAFWYFFEGCLLLAFGTLLVIAGL